MQPRYKFLLATLSCGILTVAACFGTLNTLFADRGLTLAILALTNYTFISFCVAYYMGFQRLVGHNQSVMQKIKRLNAFHIHVPGPDGDKIDESLKQKEQEMLKEVEQSVGRHERELRDTMKKKIDDEIVYTVVAHQAQQDNKQRDRVQLQDLTSASELKNKYYQGVHKGEINSYLDIFNTITSAMAGYGVASDGYYDLDGEQAKCILVLVAKVCSGRRDTDENTTPPRDLDHLLSELGMKDFDFTQGWIERSTARSTFLVS